MAFGDQDFAHASSLLSTVLKHGQLLLGSYREKNVTEFQDVYKQCDCLQSMQPAPENYSMCFSLIKSKGVIFIFSVRVLLRSLVTTIVV